MVDTAPSISTNDTIFDVGDTLYVTITFNSSVGGYLYVGDTEISIVAPRNVSSYTYSYDLTTSGVYNVHFYDYLNMLDSNIIAITVNNPTSSSAFLTKIANQGKLLDSNKEDKSNKSSSITTDTGSTTKYPTIKAIEDYAQPKGNYLTSHQDLTNYIQKNNTNGLIKNDGTIDTSIYLDIDELGNILDEIILSEPLIININSVKLTQHYSSGGVGYDVTINEILLSNYQTNEVYYSMTENTESKYGNQFIIQNDILSFQKPKELSLTYAMLTFFISIMGQSFTREAYLYTLEDDNEDGIINTDWNDLPTSEPSE